MSDFSAVNVATSGFRLIRDRPGAFFVWIGAQLLFVVVAGVGVIAAFFPLIQSLMGAVGGGPNAEAAIGMQIMNSLGQIIGLYLAIILVSLVAGSILRCAVLRANLRPEEHGFAFLRLGGDELRVMVVLVAYGLCAFVGFGVIIGGMVLATIAAKAMALLVIPVGVIGMVIGGVYLGVRLSLASAQTFYDRQINIFGTWSLTQGRFWPLLGAYALAFVFVLAVSIAGSILVNIISLVFLGIGGLNGALTAGANTDPMSLFKAMGPSLILSGIEQSIVGAISSVIFVSAAATAFDSLRPGAQAEAF